VLHDIALQESLQESLQDSLQDSCLNMPHQVATIVLTCLTLQAKGKAQAQALAQKQASINGQESYQLVSHAAATPLSAAVVPCRCMH
jgi:hypothetical protein